MQTQLIPEEASFTSFYTKSEHIYNMYKLVTDVS